MLECNIYKILIHNSWSTSAHMIAGAPLLIPNWYSMIVITLGTFYKA